MNTTHGYTDLHSHGAAGISYDGATAEDVAKALDFHKSHGTTQHVLSLITNPWPTLIDNVRKAAQIAASRPDILGLHIEGPFISPLHKGAHDPDSLQIPSPKLVAELIQAGIVEVSTESQPVQQILQVTIATELPGGLEAVRTLTSAGIIPALGHTDATFEDANAAFSAGVTHVTHVFNAMRPIHHRLPGPILAALHHPTEPTLEVIADGVHLHSDIVRMLFDLAPDRICLVTDSMSATGMPGGAYTLGKLAVTVSPEGVAKLTNSDTIAGSTLTMDTAVSNCIAWGIPEHLAIAAASRLPRTRT